MPTAKPALGHEFYEGSLQQGRLDVLSFHGDPRPQGEVDQTVAELAAEPSQGLATLAVFAADLGDQLADGVPGKMHMAVIGEPIRRL